jgi:hypothetical protein
MNSTAEGGSRGSFLPMFASSLGSAVQAKRAARTLTASFLTLITAASLLPDIAEAQYFDHYRSHQGGGGRQAVRSEEKQEPVKKPDGFLYAVVSIADQHVTFYDASGVWAKSIVSTGVEGHPTPTGVFTILEKERWHHSNIYSGAPMPYMNRITWTGVAMHEGVVTGRPASHGCIRLPGDFARKLFGVTVPGERVIVSAQEVLPGDFSHPHLPTPKFLPAPAAPAETLAAKPVETVSLTAPAPGEAGSAKLLNPLDYAKALRAAAEAKIKAAAGIKKAVATKLDAKQQELRSLGRDVQAAEDALRKMRADDEDAAHGLEKAQGDEAVQKAQARKTDTAAKLAEATQKLQAARDAREAAEREAASLEAALSSADSTVPSAQKDIKEAERRLEPVSVFITRKTGRLYVRQANQKLLDVPVTIRDADKPLGTHLFIATKPAEDGSALHWVSLTPPAAAEVIRRHHYNRNKPHASPEEENVPIAAFPETAAHALDRIEIPAEAAEAISQLLWAGGTVLISDVGATESKFAMDFQVLTRTVVHEY